MSTVIRPARPRRQPATVHPAALRLRRIFPGVTAWYGTHTGTWWAMLPDHPHLLEASTAEALEQLLAALILGHRAPSDAPTAGSAPSRPAPAGERGGAGTPRPVAGGEARRRAFGRPQGRNDAWRVGTGMAQTWDSAVSDRRPRVRHGPRPPAAQAS
ncbi:hypothetical protein LP52_25205 [Streptomonospora alba]|uniref:Uncharacterized protein n=1 Tax=Streptomonospora alba TaxID=183763 RepID=A0A0C2FZA8_9ACTN|nr:hypothetical protein [Streptomonospora alba]KIH96403.1 hypothetical protein LP52_25205 [Streptomonospora alba]